MKVIIYLLLFVILLLGFNYSFRHYNYNIQKNPGEKIDSLNGVSVYYNGGVNHNSGRNKTEDGYNLGLKYQCVEFVKRYYFEFYHHKMEDSFGNAKDFFDEKVKDGELNKKRGLLQFTNPASAQPKIGDLLIYAPNFFNKFGHVSIVSKVEKDHIEIIQQNAGPFSSSREEFSVTRSNGHWEIENDRILGWLRKDQVQKPITFP